MNPLEAQIAQAVLIGAGATAVMDAWLILLKRLNIPTLNFAFIGRWAGHWPRGRWMHKPIAKAAPIHGELALGWLLHYLTGIVFAALLIAICGPAWLAEPRLAPALALGVATVAVPWLVVQPAMGAGIASSRTPTPWRNALRSLASHAAFGVGLYIAALVVAWFWR